MRDPAADRGVHAPSQLLVRGLKIFASPRSEPRARRATDLVLLVLALVGLIATVIAYPPSGFELALQRFLAGVPGWLGPVWGFLSDLTWLLALVLVVTAIVRLRFVVVAQAVASLRPRWPSSGSSSSGLRSARGQISRTRWSEQPPRLGSRTFALPRQRLAASLLVTAGALLFAAVILPGLDVGGLAGALFGAIILGTVNGILPPLTAALALPYTIATTCSCSCSRSTHWRSSSQMP